MSGSSTNALARALRAFFVDHLPRVRGASPHTVQGYRDAIVLLLRFLSVRHSRSAVELDFDDMSPDDVLAFLDHLEQDRGNSASTRNTRLAAIHAFARHAAAGYPERIQLCQRLLAIPFKRTSKSAVGYLEAEEGRALLEAPNQTTPAGRRDHTLLLLLFNTGARVQEVVDLRPSDLQLRRPQQARLFGKALLLLSKEVSRMPLCVGHSLKSISAWLLRTRCPQGAHRMKRPLGRSTSR